MPIGAQPRGRRGTVGHPYTALNLRLVFALFGLITCAVFGGLTLAAGFDVAGWLLIGLAVIAAVDLVVIQLRRRARRRSGERSHSLFE